MFAGFSARVTQDQNSCFRYLTGRVKGERTIERIAVVMNIVPYGRINLCSQK